MGVAERRDLYGPAVFLSGGRRLDRRGRLRRIASVAIAVTGLAAAGRAGAVTDDDLATLDLPPGFAVSVFAEAPGARSMALAPELGAVFVGSRGSELHAVFYRGGAPRAERVVSVGREFHVANGIAWKDGWLYLAERTRITRWRPTRAALAPRAVELLLDGLPDKRSHGWRYAAIGPDNRLYVGVGAPCNICEVSGLEGTIIRLPLAGGAPEIFARGVRNTVGIAFHPRTGEVWFTDNGADRMGEDSPPDELNHAPRAGLDFGYPYYGGGRDRTPMFRDRPPPADAVFPALELGAHVAALGIRFYRGRMFPPDYRNDAFVAEHGSWNRSVPDGYRVMRVRFDRSGRPQRAEPFMSGFLQGAGAWGRPVDVQELPDGSLLVSDDRAGAIYRVTYRKP